MKSITVSDENGNKYKLEFTKNSIIQLEAAGFNLNSFDDSPVTMITLLTRGAFKANYPSMKAERADEIIEGLEAKDELIGKLAEMYAEHAEKLVDGGNVKWEANW